MTDIKSITPKPNDQRKALYKKLGEDLLKKKDSKALIQLVEHLVTKEGAEQYGRTYITSECISSLLKLFLDADEKQGPPLPLNELTPFAQKVADIVRPKAEDFPDAFMYALQLLAIAFQGEGDFKKAASALAQFKFDNYRGSTATIEQKMTWYIETAEFHLEANDTGPASQQLTRAHGLLKEIKSNPKLKLRFDTVYARVKDNERRFLEASMRYRDLSQNVSAGVSRQDLMDALEYSVTTAILADAGPSKSRLLALLISDERTKELPNYDLLEKMFKEQILRLSDVERFSKLLKDHHKAVMKNELTVLQNAVIGHNMFAASKMYNNIKFDELGRLLGISAKQAEEIASKMIEQRRMNGVIDQVEGIIEFSEEESAGVLTTWDGQIQDTCLMINAILDNITKKYPTYKI
jgi:COP9 signalosome complex subunit 4